MHVLVTGGCGYVGSVLVPKLLSIGHIVTVIDAQWFGNYLRPDPRLTGIEQDIRTLSAIPDDCDAVIHLASIANDPCCDLDPQLSWEVNCLATMRLAEAAARAGVRHFVYASSGSVYGVSDAPQVTEDTPLVPISDYNRTKMCAERIVLSYARDMVVQIVRPATVCGMSPRMRLDVVVNMLTMQALDRGKIRVFGGDQIRPHIHIEDMAALYVWLLDHPERDGIYNAGFENMSVRQLADRISSRKVPAAISLEPSDDPRSYRLNSDRLLRAGFEPTHSVDNAIDEIAESYNRGLLSNAPQHYNLRWMGQMGVAG